MDDYSKEIKSFLNSSQGKEMIRSIKEDLYLKLLNEAGREPTADSAFGLIKEASGVIKTIEHIMFLSVSMGERNED